MKTLFSRVHKQRVYPAAPSAPFALVLKRVGLWCAVVCLLAGSSEAADITGSVLNKNTQRFLERAEVQVSGTPFRALTDRDGSFRLSGVPAGTYSIVATYAGLEAKTQTITVTEDQLAKADFEMTSEIYRLGEFVVQSTVEGTAFAINQQRRAESARSVTSIDAFIDQVTGNPGEFLKNVPGIQMDFSQNEPQLIRLRGMDPSLTSVTMDGNDVATAASSGTGRALQIDQLSLALIENVEVFKAPIPSMSANAIGGAVNFNTRSAFDQKGRRSSVTVGVTMDSHDFNFSKTPGPGHGDPAMRRVLPIGRFDFSDAFLDNRLGVVFSLGRDDTNQLGSSVTNGIVVAALPGTTLPPVPTPYTLGNVSVRRGNFAYAPNRQRRTRNDISLNLDYKLTPSTVMFFKSTFTDYLSTNRNHSFNVTPVTVTPGFTPTTYSSTNATFTQGSSVFEPKGTQSWQLNPGLRYKSGNWKAELVGGFSKSVNDYRNPSTFTAVNIAGSGPTALTVTTPLDSETPSSVVITGGVDPYNLDNYRVNQTAVPAGATSRSLLANATGFVSNNNRYSTEVRYSGRFDLQRNFATRLPFYLKGGMSFNEQTRVKTQPQHRWSWVGPDGAAGTPDDNLPMGIFAEPVPVTMQIPNFGLREPTYISTRKVYEYLVANPQAFLFNEAYAAQQRRLGLQKFKEEIAAGYFMGAVTVRNLFVLAGVRVEETTGEAQGVRTLPTSGPRSVLPAGVNANSLQAMSLIYQDVRTTNRYTSDPFPYLHLKYALRPNLQARGSYTEAIGRPDISQQLPNVSQNDNAVPPSITVNNNALKPQRSKNLDFSLEYYTKSTGEWTFSWFSRDVEDYLSSTTSQITPELLADLDLDSSYSNYVVNTNTNLGSAKWAGFELGMRQRLSDFRFLPEFLRGVEIWANSTRIYQQEGTFGASTTAILAGTAPKLTQLAGTVHELYNGGVSYRTPNGKYYVQLKTNYQGPTTQVNLPATNAAGQQGALTPAYQFWDMEMSYRLSPRIKLTATGRNLFKERRTTQVLGNFITNRQQDTGILWTFSTKIDL
jgi:TonB-dependent receptor